MPENSIQKLKRKKRDKKIRKLYPALTLEEIAKRNKLTAERIRQILKVEKNKIK